MRNVLRIAGLVAFLAVLPAANAADVSGTWKGAFDFQGTNLPLTFQFTVANGAVTGTVEGMLTTPAQIHDGKVDGGTLTFWVNSDYQGQTYKLVFKGAVSATGDQIAFTFGTEDGSWGAQMTVARSAETAPAPAGRDVTGTWKGNFDFQGTSMPLAIHLTSSAGVVTGTVEGLPTTPAEIHEGKLDGDTVTFWLNTDYQGQTYKLLYKGKISAGQIAFTFGTDDGSWGAQMTATKSAETAPATAGPDVTGTWKGSFESQGTNFSLTIHLTNAAGVVTGTVEGLPTTPAEIHEGKLDGDTVSFWLTTDYQGQNYKVICKGKVSAGKIAFTLALEDGSWSTDMVTTKAM